MRTVIPVALVVNLLGVSNASAQDVPCKQVLGDPRDRNLVFLFLYRDLNPGPGSPTVGEVMKYEWVRTFDRQVGAWEQVAKLYRGAPGWIERRYLFPTEKRCG